MYVTYAVTADMYVTYVVTAKASVLEALYRPIYGVLLYRPMAYYTDLWYNGVSCVSRT